MNCLVISGMSGAGKSLAVDLLEDVGYYCVDNMPVALISKFVELFLDSTAKYKRVAFVVDSRSGTEFDRLFETINEMHLMGVNCHVLFLDASNEVLINRQKESRRRHPLDVGGLGLVSAIAEERHILERMKNSADYLIDTSALSPSGLRGHLINLFSEENAEKSMIISLNTFGFKYGLPPEADIVFDVRFLKNPYYIPELRHKTGLDYEVANYVFSSPDADEFCCKMIDLLQFLLPRYIKEGKTSLVVSIGCTGGRHRSVAICERLAHDLTAKGNYVVTRHRDSSKG